MAEIKSLQTLSCTLVKWMDGDIVDVRARDISQGPQMMIKGGFKILGLTLLEIAAQVPA